MVFGALVIASGDAPEVLDTVEEAFDDVVLPIKPALEMAVNVFPASRRVRSLSRCFSRDGALPAAICSRASSRRLRASLRLTSG